MEILPTPFSQIRPNRSLMGAIMAVLCLILFLLTTEGPSYAVIPQLWPPVRGAHVSVPLSDPAPYALAKAGHALGTGQAIPIVPDAPLSLSARLETGPAAASYVFKGRTSEDAARALRCLTSAIYYEAASESSDGQRAVAQVVLNRVRHPAWPNSICGVVYQGSEKPGCQFTYACDGSMARIPMAAAWQKAEGIARAALSGAVFAPVGLATYYHTLAVNPAWNKPLTITAVIGRHIFYRLPGDQSSPSAFADRYAAIEPVPGPRRPLPAPLQMTSAGQWVAPAPVLAPQVHDDPRYVKGALPESDILPQYRQSGTWLHE
jgi:hypothetical protein